MVRMHLRKGSNKEILSPIPSYISKELKLENKQEVDVKLSKGKIIVTPCKKKEEK